MQACLITIIKSVVCELLNFDLTKIQKPGNEVLYVNLLSRKFGMSHSFEDIDNVRHAYMGTSSIVVNFTSQYSTLKALSLCLRYVWCQILKIFLVIASDQCSYILNKNSITLLVNQFSNIFIT